MSMSQLNTRETKLDTKFVENVRDRKNLLWIDNVNICSNNKLQMCVILSKMTCLQYWLKSFFCNKRMKWMLETLTVRIVFAQCYHHHVHLKWCTQHSCFWHFIVFEDFFINYKESICLNFQVMSILRHSYVIWNMIA